MNESIDIPAAWRGEELLEREDWLHELDAAAIAELEDAATRGSFELPTVAPLLARIQHSLEHGSGAAIIRGLPIESFSEDRARALFDGIARHVGTPVSQSAGGELIFSVRDEGYGSDDRRTRGPNTRRRLSFHTDRCDVIAFLCLKQAKSGGENFVVSSATLYNEMLARRPDLVKVLRGPFTYKRHNVDGGNERAHCEQPVFSIHEGQFAANYLRVLIDRADADPELPSLTPFQREALDFLEELAEDPALHVRFMQRPGDVLFLNNWVTLHRRSEFEDRDEPELRRHLLRIWLSVPNSRPLAPAFEANYGATAAGAIRGGMRARG